MFSKCAGTHIYHPGILIQVLTQQGSATTIMPVPQTMLHLSTTHQAELRSAAEVMIMYRLNAQITTAQIKCLYTDAIRILVSALSAVRNSRSSSLIAAAAQTLSSGCVLSCISLYCSKFIETAEKFSDAKRAIISFSSAVHRSSLPGHTQNPSSKRK